MFWVTSQNQEPVVIRFDDDLNYKDDKPNNHFIPPFQISEDQHGSKPSCGQETRNVTTEQQEEVTF